MLGQTISHYKILEKLGQGGMGEVWLAEDTRLGRKVALKFLAPELARDRESLMRFRNEARAVAGLSHSNIATIHDIGEVDGSAFLVLEYLEGMTLKERIAQSPLSIEEVVRVGRAIAAGLAVAHSNGIVHRDIKSANIMLTDKGDVKILDFGLARRGDATQLTRPGSTLGTVHYMSPEQARGQSADERSDIWSVGVVLYECLTGQCPFSGESTASIINQITSADPSPPTSLRTGIPVDLERCVLRCMDKIPAHRYQHVDDLFAELERMHARSDSATSPASREVASRRRVGLAVILVLLYSAFALYLVRRPGEVTLRLGKPLQVTTHIATESHPSLSPDGQMVAYASHQSGNWDIWIQQVGSVYAINRTEDHEGWDSLPSWSPDGKWIAFASTRDGGGVFVMPAIAGTPRKVGTASVSMTWLLDAGSYPQWSTDGSRLAFMVAGGDSPAVVITSLETSTSQEIVLPGRWDYRYGLSWSPDDRYFAYVDANGLPSDTKQIWVLRVADEVSSPVTDGLFDDWSPCWPSDGAMLAYSSNRGGARDLWTQRINADGSAAGEPRRLTTGIGMRDAGFTGDGARLTYTVERPQYNIYQLDLSSDEMLTWDDVEQLTFEQTYLESIDLSPDGRTLLFNSTRSGNHDLYSIPVEGGPVTQITTHAANDWWPRWSPDGTQVCFYSYRSGNRDIWVIPATGGSARQLTTDESMDLNPAWSPDGRRIAFNSNRGGNQDIWLVSTDGGEIMQLTEYEGWDANAEWSADGKWVHVVSERSGERGLWRVSVDGEAIEQLTPGDIDFHRSSPDGSQIFFARDGNLWSLSLMTRTERLVADLDGRLRSNNRAFGMCTDGKRLFFSWGTDLMDVWVMDVLRD